MSFYCIKLKNDNNKFTFFKVFGADIVELEDPEETDKTILDLINKDCNNIVLSYEIASFSTDIVRKYSKDKNINIYIVPKNSKT